MNIPLKISLLLSLVFSLLVPQIGLAQNVRKKQRLVLTYEEFRQKNKANQEMYLETLRAFYLETEKIFGTDDIIFETAEIEPIQAFPWLKVTAWLPKFCALVSTPVYAGGYNKQIIYDVGTFEKKVCIWKEGTTLDQSQNCSVVPAASARKINDSAAAQASAESEAWKKLGVTADAATDQGSQTYWNGTNKMAGTPADNDFAEALDSSPAKAAPATANAPADKKPAAKAEAPAQAATARPAGKAPALSAEENAKLNKSLMCIYAGWPVTSSDVSSGKKPKCRSISQKEMKDKDGKAVIYSCRKPKKETVKTVAEAGADELLAGMTPVNAPAKAKAPVVNGNGDGLSTVLCNPLLFGLAKDNLKPICIPRSKTATADCDKKAKEVSPDYSTGAAQLAAKNEKDFNSLSNRVEKLCNSDSNDEIDYVKALKADPKNAKRLADLSDTCETVRTMLASVNKQRSGGEATRTGGQ